MNKYQPFHDSGIVDEGLSDETGSVEEEFNNQDDQLGKIMTLNLKIFETYFVF
jgi:hypothetical protein